MQYGQMEYIPKQLATRLHMSPVMIIALLTCALAYAGLSASRPHLNLAASQIGQQSSQTPEISPPATQLDATSSSDAAPAANEQANNSSSVQVTVNGQDMPVPANGQLHTTLSDGNSTTHVDVSNSSTGNSSSSHISVHSSSSSSTQEVTNTTN